MGGMHGHGQNMAELATRGRDPNGFREI